MEKHREIEAKLEVATGTALPDLTALAGVASVDAPVELALEAVYLDTPDLRLAHARTTLRRRTGGLDAGWHVKLPVSAQERIELRAALGPEQGGSEEPLPGEIAAAVAARVRGATIEPVVVLHTRRTVRLLRDPAGRVLAEVADDEVTSRAPAATDVVVDAWREWEFELVEGDHDLLDAAVDLLTRSEGATPAHPSKLARALGDRLASRTERVAAQAPAARTAGAALRDHLRTQRDNLLARDPQVRRDEPDSVHQMRVTTRQLRSTLASFRPLLTGPHGEHLRAELGWLGEVLGVARDAEVARARLAELVAAEPVDLVLGPVGQRLDDDRAQAYRAAHRQVLAELDSVRYFQLLDSLDDFADAPPLTAAAVGRAKDVLPARVRHEWKRLARAARAARAAPPGPRRDEHLHETRKAAKRARYAAEAVSPVLGRRAEKFASAAKDLQTLLGDHHDTVELRAVLRRVGSQAQLAGESTFTYGRLHALEQSRAASLEARLPEAWHRMSVRGRRRWLH